MRTVTVKSVSKMLHVVSSNKHGFVADESTEAGDDLGMDPHELMLASLGT